MIKCEKDDIVLFNYMRMHTILEFPSMIWAIFLFIYVWEGTRCVNVSMTIGIGHQLHLAPQV